MLRKARPQFPLQMLTGGVIDRARAAGRPATLPRSTEISQPRDVVAALNQWAGRGAAVLSRLARDLHSTRE